jgi:hypothetical protein
MVLNAFERALNNRDEDPHGHGLSHDGMHMHHFSARQPSSHPSLDGKGRSWAGSHSRPRSAASQSQDERDADRDRDPDLFGDFGEYYDPEFDGVVR